MRNRVLQTVRIPNGESLSAPVRLNGYDLVGILMPGDWTAADLTFQAADSPEGTFLNVYDDAGNEVNVDVDAGRAVVVREGAARLRGFTAIKVRSGTSGAAVNQNDDRDLKLVLRRHV
jgi:hypothetical protein